MTFINYSNHPSTLWSNKMIAEARSYGDIIDMPFFAVNPSLSGEEVEIIATKEVNSIVSQYPDHNDVVIMIQGEMVLLFKMVTMLKDKGYRCVAGTSERICKETGNGRKESIFEFVRFREY